jgi:chloride channel 7
VLLAVVGGWVASVFTSFNTWVCLVRKKWSKFFSFRILEVGGFAASPFIIAAAAVAAELSCDEE